MSEPTGQPEPLGYGVAYELLFHAVLRTRKELERVRLDLAQSEVAIVQIMARLDYALDKGEFTRGSASDG
jgi:hypothetical protein